MKFKGVLIGNGLLLAQHLCSQKQISVWVCLYDVTHDGYGFGCDLLFPGYQFVRCDRTQLPNYSSSLIISIFIEVGRVRLESRLLLQIGYKSPRSFSLNTF